MTTVLVVDDSSIDRLRAGRLLEKGSSSDDTAAATGIRVIYASNGREALEVLAQHKPDLVLTDLQMPEMNGLELVEEVRSRFPLTPIILMTAHGSEDIAIQALQRGAASYVPKRQLADELLDTIDHVLSASAKARDQQRVLECLMSTESQLVLENDLDMIPPLIAYLRDNVSRMNLCDETGLIRLTIALSEALTNAIVHGNLEVSSELRTSDESHYHSIIKERRFQKPYRERRVYITTHETLAEASFTIRDEGPGFDPKCLPDPTDPTNLDRVSGRGLLLIRTFMDHIEHNATGNQITMIKKRDK